jgi:Domain of unknown function (DUF5615)
LRFLIDEMYPASVAEQLRARGRDAVSVHDAEYRHLEGAPDDELFRVAVGEGRRLVTENVPDFRRLESAALARGDTIPGLVYSTNRQFPRGDPATIGRLVLALDALAAQPTTAVSTFLTPTR